MKPEFTQEQIDYVCWMIGEWYLDWKHCIANYDDRTHRLGYAKEKLKDLIFPSNSGSEESEGFKTFRRLNELLKLLNTMPLDTKGDEE